MADQREDDAVQNSTVLINWRTFNIPSLITVVVTAIGMVTYVNSLDARVAKRTVDSCAWRSWSR